MLAGTCATGSEIDIVAPLHNEQAILERSVTRPHAYLRDGFPLADRARRQREHRRHAGDRRGRPASCPA
jgi:hypothetical protein